MKTKFLCLLSILFVTALCISFSSCGDGGGGGEDNLVITLRANKWYCSSNDVNVYSNTHASLETNAETLYFMEGNQGYSYFMYKDRDNKVGSTFKDEWVAFTYHSNGDNSVTITYSNGNNSVTLNYVDGCLYNGSDIYTRKDLTPSDAVYEYIKWKDLEYNIKTKVRLTSTKMPHCMRFDFTSYLAEAYPNDAKGNICYGVEYICDDFYFDEEYDEGIPGVTYMVYALIPEAQILYERVQEIERKAIKTQEEKEFLELTIEGLKDIRDNTICKPYVKVRGKIYYL